MRGDTSGLSGLDLVLRVPAQRLHEYEYGAAVLFGACLDWPVRVEAGNDAAVQLLRDGHPLLTTPVLQFPEMSGDELTQITPGVAQFLPVGDISALWPATLPGLVNPGEEKVPEPIAVIDGTVVSVPFDLLWTVYFVASGAWEIRFGVYDDHQGVSGLNSWLSDNGFIRHPVINYYAKTLAMLIGQQSQLREPARQYSRQVSCDVDRPFDPACYKVSRFVKRLARNVCVERSFSAAQTTVDNWSAVRKNGWQADPNNAFDYMLEHNERAGNQIQFFFIAENENPYDAEYDLKESRIQQLIKKLVDAGHRVGLHGSFESQFEENRLGMELNRLRDAVSHTSAVNSEPANRQHWLRWHPRTSPGTTYKSGLREDWTLGFNDCSGFRRSICVPFPMFDFETAQTLDLIERPLLAMECAEIGVNHTTNADWEGIETRYRECADQCREVSGEFHLLWHNHHLVTPHHREMYERLIHA